METHFLSSWKEIAKYFGKGIRTVQRWEKELGLPVHRPTPDTRSVVAIPQELNAWLLSNGEETVSRLRLRIMELENENRELRKQAACGKE